MTKISEALVLMAGVGSRLVPAGTRDLKPLIPVLGRPLVAYLFDSLRAAGIEIVHAIVGYESESLIAQIKPIVPNGLEVRFVQNTEWRKQNGISVLTAAGQVNSPFLLSMSDHLFDNEMLGLLLQKARPTRLNLAVDRKIESIVDIDDAMKVQTKYGRIIAIGKNLTRYDAIDTGLFVANEELFQYLEAAKRDGDCSLADGVRLMAKDGKVRAVDIGDAWWQDVDTPQTLAAAEKHLEPISQIGTGAGSQTQG
jgi:choline kinase